MKIVFGILLLCLSSAIAFAEEEKKDVKTSDSLFGEDGEYNVSVSGGGVEVHREFDDEGKPKSGEGEEGSQSVEAVGRGFHEQRKADRRERKRKLEEQKEKAKDARR